MTSLSFQTTKSALCEPGASGKIGALLRDMGASKVLLVSDPGVIGAGLTDRARASMDEAGLAFELFGDVVADPPERLILDAVDLARAQEVDAVVGLGGGSSMDTAKLIAFLAVSQQPLSEIYGIGQCRGDRLPLVLVPTTAGTGSEVTPIAIVTTGESEKKGVVSSQLLPDLAILDAELTLGLPRHVTAATGVDAMVHAIEAYTSKIKKNPISDALARQALTLLAANLRRVCEAPDDTEARSDMLLGSMLAGMAFTNAPVGAVHALAYPLGGHFHVPHGLSNSLVLTEVMRFNAPAAADLYSEIAPLIFPELAATDGEARNEGLIAGLESLIADVGLETQLRQVGVSHNHLPMLAEDAMKQTRLLVNNPREVTYEDALAIYERAL